MKDKKESLKKLFIVDRYWSYFLYNTETSLTSLEKALAVLQEGKTDCESGSHEHRAALSQNLRHNHWFDF